MIFSNKRVPTIFLDVSATGKCSTHSRDKFNLLRDAGMRAPIPVPKAFIDLERQYPIMRKPVFQ